MNMSGLRATVAALLLALVAGPALANPADESADREQRLREAREALERAAREIAELTTEVYGPGLMRHIEMHIGGPRRAMLGINLGPAEGGDKGVRVQGVSPGGPAADAGVKAGDVITGIDGKPVGTGRDLLQAMEGVEPGQKVALELRRDGRSQKVTVTARESDRPMLAQAFAMPHGPLQGGAPMHGRHWLLAGWGDAELVTMTPGLGRYFGTDKGVLVVRAPSDSALGLQDGDVIQAIGSREPQNAPHAMRILRSYQPGETIELRIMRDRKAQTLRGVAPEGPVRIQRRERIVVPGKTPPAPAAPPAPRPPGASPTSA